MKIFYLSGTPLPSRAASTVNVMKMCAAFSKLGHDVTLFVRPGSIDMEDVFAFYNVTNRFNICTVDYEKLSIARGIQFATAVRKYVGQHGVPDLFYGRHPYSLLSVCKFGVPVVFEAHQVTASRPVTFAQKRLFSQSAFAGVTAITRALANDLLAVFPKLSRGAFYVAPDGADPVDLDVPAKPDWPYRPEALQVGYVGHLFAGKGMELILEIARMRPDMDFHIVGGRDEDIANWQARGTPVNIYFHGFAQQKQLAGFYRRFDVVIAPLQRRVALAGDKHDISRWTSPLKVFEYMAHRMPIIASDLTVLQEVLKDGHNAILADPCDPNAWVRHLDDLYHDASLRKRLSLQAHQDFLQRYTWEQRAKDILNWLTPRSRA